MPHDDNSQNQVNNSKNCVQPKKIIAVRRKHYEYEKQEEPIVQLIEAAIKMIVRSKSVTEHKTRKKRELLVVSNTYAGALGSQHDYLLVIKFYGSWR